MVNGAAARQCSSQLMAHSKATPWQDIADGPLLLLALGARLQAQEKKGTKRKAHEAHS